MTCRDGCDHINEGERRAQVASGEMKQNKKAVMDALEEKKKTQARVDLG